MKNFKFFQRYRGELKGGGTDVHCPVGSVKLQHCCEAPVWPGMAGIAGAAWEPGTGDKDMAEKWLTTLPWRVQALFLAARAPRWGPWSGPGTHPVLAMSYEPVQTGTVALTGGTGDSLEHREKHWGKDRNMNPCRASTTKYKSRELWVLENFSPFSNIWEES